MTYRINDKDLKGQLERLYRNTDNKIQFEIQQYNGYYHLVYVMNEFHGTENISNGNTKSELYWQIVGINKVLELARNKEIEN